MQHTLGNGNILHLPELEKQICDLEDLRMLIQTNQDKLFLATIFISLNAETLEELNERTKILESELKRLQENVILLNKEISNFIKKRVHPKSRKKLQKLLLDYSNAIFLNTAKENELYYRYGAEDGVKFIIDSLNAK